MGGAGGGGCVRAARGTGRTVLLAGEGVCGHGTAVACVAAPGGAGAAGAGSGVSWWCLREREQREWVAQERWPCGERERRGGCAVRGRSGSAAVFRTGLRRGTHLASQEALAGPGGTRVVPPGTGGGEVPHPPWICRVGVRRRWGRWRLVVRVECLSRRGLGPGGPFGLDVVAGRIRFLVSEGWPLVVGGVWGESARVLTSHALVVLVHTGLWPGGVGWWAVVVVVVVLVVVVVGALVAVALVVVVMVLRVWP